MLVMTTLVIAIAMVLPAGLYVGLNNVESVSQGWDGAARLSLFLKFSVDDRAAEELRARLASLETLEHRLEGLTDEQVMAELGRPDRHPEAAQKARDKVLLNTFRSEDDILLARDGKLATYDAQIRIAYTNIERLKAWLETQKKKAAALERKGRKIPAKLLKEIENTRHQIKANYESILRQEKDKEFIRKKYAADLARFRELKELKTAQAENEKNTGQKRYDAIVETVIVCDGKVDCDRAWERAKKYARKHATTRTYVDTRKMFMTQPPKEKTDLSITVSRLRPEPDKPEIIFMDVACRKQVASDTWCETEEARKIRNEFRRHVLGEK
ncbi:MAG: hypothetical protein DSZ02_01405 [Gammaproteobacteria bacterium]|nr:MAG: hypothetical protein DSZ02_01405 [Gammaproteobacteria bacterium]